MPAEVTLPRTARIAPEVLLSASPCRVVRLTRFVRKRYPRFPSTAVMQPPAMADRGIPVESEPRVRRPQISTWRVGLSEPAGGAKVQIRRGWAGDGNNRSDAPCRITGERVIYAECVAAGGQRSRMRPGPMYWARAHPSARKTTPRL